MPKGKPYRCMNDNCKVYKVRSGQPGKYSKNQMRHVIFYGFIGDDSFIKGVRCQSCEVELRVNMDEKPVDKVDDNPLQLRLKKTVNADK